MGTVGGTKYASNEASPEEVTGRQVSRRKSRQLVLDKALGTRRGLSLHGTRRQEENVRA